jgi:hypothetical protein
MSEEPKNFPPIYNAENAQNPAAPNSNNAIDSDPNGEKGFGAVDAGGNVQGVDTQTGSQAKGMGGDDFTKHRFNETPGNGGNGGNGGNSSGSGDGDATKVGSAYWQF